MQKISWWTDLVAAFGRFRYGSLTAGMPPTPIKAEWLNMVQEEMTNLVLAYLPALDAADNAQVLQALQKAIELSLVNYALKATTLDGYGITDAYTKAATDALLLAKAAKATTLDGYGITDAYTKAAADTLLLAKAAKATTLSGYGITDAYTKVAADALLLAKQDKSTGLMQENGFHLCKATGKLQQWGVAIVGPDAVSDPINFPTPFAQVYVCFGNKITANSVDGDGNAAGACAISLTQYKVFNDSNTFGATIHWTAIGKAPGY